MPSRADLLLVWMILGIGALFFMVFTAAWWQHRQETPSRAQRRADQAERLRQASTVATRAREAAARAGAARSRASGAERTTAAAWQELEQARVVLAEAVHAHAALVRDRDATPRPPPAGQRELAHAALAAYRRGDLSEEDLWRVWRWETGWEPELDERERAVWRARAAWRAAHLRYRAAAGRERAAHSEAEVAEVEVQALAEEAATLQIPDPR